MSDASTMTPLTVRKYTVWDMYRDIVEAATEVHVRSKDHRTAAKNYQYWATAVISDW